jgi:hypothetical protein
LYDHSDYKEFFISSFPKIHETKEQNGYILYKLNKIKNDIHLKNKQINVEYHKFTKFIKPLNNIDNFKYLLKLIWELFVNRNTISNYDIHSHKYSCSLMNEQIIFLENIFSYLTGVFELEDEAYHYLLNLIMINESIQLNDKFMKESKNIFQIKRNQNNIQLYCNYLLWAFYYKKYDLCNNIIQLLNKKIASANDMNLNDYHIVTYYSLVHSILQCLSNKISYNDFLTILNNLYNSVNCNDNINSIYAKQIIILYNIFQSLSKSYENIQYNLNLENIDEIFIISILNIIELIYTKDYSCCNFGEYKKYLLYYRNLTLFFYQLVMIKKQ